MAIKYAIKHVYSNQFYIEKDELSGFSIWPTFAKIFDNSIDAQTFAIKKQLYNPDYEIKIIDEDNLCESRLWRLT